MNLQLQIQRGLPVISLACALALAACDANQPASSQQDLGAIAIPGTASASLSAEAEQPLSATLAFLQSFLRVQAQADVETRTLNVDAQTSNEALAASVTQALGKGWRRDDSLAMAPERVRTMVWESADQPKRFFALAVYEQSPPRSMVLMFTKPSAKP